MMAHVIDNKTIKALSKCCIVGTLEDVFAVSNEFAKCGITTSIHEDELNGFYLEVEKFEDSAPIKSTKSFEEIKKEWEGFTPIITNEDK